MPTALIEGMALKQGQDLGACHDLESTNVPHDREVNDRVHAEIVQMIKSRLEKKSTAGTALQ
ncbi:hypothetical protein RUM43_007016 [Polyplax serrata]|uniref:Uncharacterized protein n=1 Tax=Polyplax serrata TaxID=468196 RepID=A0AAN8S120_POLSC